MTTSLREGLTFCRLANRIVFLDIPADRYFCLSQEAESVFSRACTGEQLAEFERALLYKTGVVRRSSGGLDLHECVRQAPQQSALEQPAIGGSRIAMARLCARFLYARSSLLHRGLAPTLASMVRLKPKQDTADPTGVSAIADAYRRCTRIIGAHDQCLPYAIAVARSLFAAGAAADLIIGVGMPPFRAHAWVQWRDVLVNEHLEIAARYTPIAVL